MIKDAHTQNPINALIAKRWSARSFDAKPIEDKDIHTILEAGTWAASANNEQPWQFFYAKHGTEGFEKIWNCLMPGNQPWAKNAGAFIVSVARKTFAGNDKPNAWAEHDLGMANAQILLQAADLNIFCHPMAGVLFDKLTETLSLSETQRPVCVIALGHLDAAEKLEEPFRTRELTPRSRKPLNEVAWEI